MPIRMRDWGLKAYPGQGVQVPLSGINGMNESARDVSRGLESLGEAGREFAEMYDRVQTAGEFSKLDTALQGVASGAQEKLNAAGEVPDWGESWQRETTEGVEKALGDVSESRREKARTYAAEVMRKAGLEARRAYEVQRIAAAREAWKSRVESAVATGNVARARACFDEGRGVFVSEGEAEAQREALGSRCQASAWHNAVQENPLETLVDWNSGRRELPAGAAEAEAVVQELEETGTTLRRRLGERCAESWLQGGTPDAPSLVKASQAGLLHYDAAARTRALSAQEETEWMRRADACGADEDAVAEMRLKLTALPAPAEQRRRLVQYFEEGRALPDETRRRISDAVWNVVCKGNLGGAGDAVPRHRAARLMREGRRLAASGDEQSLTDWLSRLNERKPVWLCFGDNNK